MNPPRPRKPPMKRTGFWATMANRPTADLIVLGLTVVVALSVLAVVLTMLWVQITDHDADTTALAKQVGAFVSSIIAVIVGYIAGRGVDGD